MTKEYIRLNNNDNHLSLGNLFRIIKDMAKNKRAALQTEIFCTMFDIDNINDTTVNNYCLGARSIGSDYKQIYLNKKKKYEIDNEEFCDIVLNILSIIDGFIYDIKDNKKDFIKKNNSIKELCKKLYNIAKNDNDVSNELVDNIKKYIDINNYYDCLVIIMLFIVLDKKQPIYEDSLKKEVLENILNDTSISAKSLEEYLSLKLKEGINYDLSMKLLAINGNAYACYELGCNEYYGYYKGYPRYDEAYKYFIKAAEYNHASAIYMLGCLYSKGLISNKSNKDLEKSYNYFVKASELGNIAALNSLGIMYYEGIYPVKKDINKAKELFIKASKVNYAYAFNNLARLDKEKEYEYLSISANLGESWACNKIGLYYWNNGDEKEAYRYWNKAIEASKHTLCYYAYYNLAKYFYLYGYDEVKKDYYKAIEYLNIAKDNGILEAIVLLLIIRIEEKNKNVINELVNEIERHPKYNDIVRINVEKILKSIKNNRKINSQLIEDLL